MTVDPIARAWSLVNPRAPFPQALARPETNLAGAQQKLSTLAREHRATWRRTGGRR